jgi:hypothetical protein
MKRNERFQNRNSHLSNCQPTSRRTPSLSNVRQCDFCGATNLIQNVLQRHDAAFPVFNLAETNDVYTQ